MAVPLARTPARPNLDGMADPQPTADPAAEPSGPPAPARPAGANGGGRPRPRGRFARLMELLARPVRSTPTAGGIVLQPFRGYGTAEQVFLIGRVLRQPDWGRDLAPGLLRDVIDVGRRLAHRGVAGAEVEAELLGATATVATDRDGYFRVRMAPGTTPDGAARWHPMTLRLVRPAAIEAQAAVFLTPPSARRVVISDIDDTVMHTGVANKLKMLWHLYGQDADRRVPFPGVGAFYRALGRGPDADADRPTATGQGNPLLFVSRAPWGIYDVLTAFFEANGLPGPLLFLREWGMRITKPLPRRALDHKRHLIEHMLEVIGDRPVILIGDSGQRDPEVYARVVHDFPGRVAAVFIRDLDRDADRSAAIRAMAEEVAAAGAELVLATDSLAMAERAAALGFIAGEDLDAVRTAMAADQGERG
jgi:phosphatidate phosphatase APP1